MKDVRISIRLSQEEHMALKLLAIHKRKPIQDLLHKCVVTLISKGANNVQN